MDRALKERIVGAIVLVVLAVLVVPVFLDGPETEPEVLTERIPLPGQVDQTVKVVVLERDRQAPVPQAAVAVDPDTASGEDTDSDDVSDTAIILPVPQPQAETVVETPAPALRQSTEPESAAEKEAPRQNPVAVIEKTMQSATGMWAVQIGSFSSKPNADTLAADLRRQGFAAFLSETTGASGPLHRVRVGPQKDRPAAEAMLVRLRDAGQRGQVVPHP
jgi:DedD protein